jgi:hypothetical protein
MKKVINIKNSEFLLQKLNFCPKNLIFVKNRIFAQKSNFYRVQGFFEKIGNSPPNRGKNSRPKK